MLLRIIDPLLALGELKLDWIRPSADEKDRSPVLGVALTILSPEHMSILWTDPTGIKMVVVALILQVAGTLIIRKLVDIEY